MSYAGLKEVSETNTQLDFLLVELKSCLLMVNLHSGHYASEERREMDLSKPS